MCKHKTFLFCMAETQTLTHTNSNIKCLHRKKPENENIFIYILAARRETKKQKLHR